jgi:parvulin-like peptidyl-prolyl isomerase
MDTGFDNNQQAELASWKMWPHLLHLQALDQASASTLLEPEEAQKVWQSYCKSRGIDHEAPETVPSEFIGLPPEQLKSVVLRDVRIAKWKQESFGPGVAQHFARRKSALDRVVYSMVRVTSSGLARELGFRLVEGESDFAELARGYSAGEERHTCGVMGPVALGTIHPSLAVALQTAKIGELLGPLQVAEWFVLARVETHLPAELDDEMREQMIDELALLWIKEETDAKRGN